MRCGKSAIDRRRVCPREQVVQRRQAGRHDGAGIVAQQLQSAHLAAVEIPHQRAILLGRGVFYKRIKPRFQRRRVRIDKPQDVARIVQFGQRDRVTAFGKALQIARQ